MNLTLAQLRARVAGKIGMSSVEELALIDSWLNEGVEQYLVETKAVVREASMALTAGVSTYTLPPEVESFAHAWIATADGDQGELDRIDFGETIARRRTGAVGPYSTVFEVRGNMLFVDPAPSAGQVIKMLYVPTPTLMVADGDSPADAGVPGRDVPIIEAYASWKAADWDDDTSSKVGQTYMQDYELGLRKARMRRSRMGGGWGPARAGRRRYIPLSPGTDTGN